MKTTRPIAIHLDRLSAALAVQGCRLKRTQLLEVAAAAFGYHNVHECSAASKRGDLTPLKARLLCRVAIPMRGDDLRLPIDGRDRILVVVQDEHGDVHAIADTAMLEKTNDPAAAYVVTPAGGIIDVSCVIGDYRRITGSLKDPEVADEVLLDIAHIGRALSNGSQEIGTGQTREEPADVETLTGLSMMTVAYAISKRYKGQPVADGEGVLVRCPVHDDENPSLRITGDANDLRMRCMAGCADHAVQKTVLDLMCRNAGDPERIWDEVYEVHATFDGETYREVIGVRGDEDIEVKARRLIAAEFRIPFDEKEKWAEDQYEFDGEIDTISIEYAELDPAVAALAVTIRRAMGRMADHDPLRAELARGLRDIMPSPTITD